MRSLDRAAPQANPPSSLQEVSTSWPDQAAVARRISTGTRLKNKFMLTIRRLFFAITAVASLGVIVSTTLRWEFLTPFSPSDAQQNGHAGDNAAKYTDQPTGPARPRTGGSVEIPAAANATGGDNSATGDVDAKLAAIGSKLDELIRKKFDELERHQQQRWSQYEAANWSWQSRWGFWALVGLGIATLSTLLVLVMRGSSGARRSNRTGTRPNSSAYPQFAEGSNLIQSLLRKFEEQSERTKEVMQWLGQLHAVMTSLASEVRDLPTSIVKEMSRTRSREAPAEPVLAARKSSPAREIFSLPQKTPVSPPGRGDSDGPRARTNPASALMTNDQLDSNAPNVVRDFQQMVVDDSRTGAFLERWHPQSVIMVNFEQRVKESGLFPELIVKNSPSASNDEHFWFIPLASSQVGYILPARRLLLHRSALRGEGAAKLFRLVFEIIPSESFNVEQPAYAAVEEERVRITQEGAIRLPY
jgi:hypothetical protein